MRLLKRKKGMNYYYYLQHSFRLNGKVTTKEKYLGKVLPKDIEKIKRDFKKEIQPELYLRLEAIRTKFRKDWGKLPQSIKVKQQQELAITFTYHTNAIEGSTISEPEVRGIILDKISPGKPLRDIKEAEAHNEVFLKMLEKEKPIVNSLLMEWYKNIFSPTKSELAGKCRNYNVRVGSYIAPDYSEVSRLMNQMMKFIKNNQHEINPVELAAIAHYRFEKIHPFGDGNGRIGRLLMNNILWFSKYPILIIEYNKRNAYYNALSRGEDGFTNYFLKTYLRVHG